MANKRFGNYLVGEINPDQMNRIPFHHVDEAKQSTHDFVMILSTEGDDGEFRIEYDDSVPIDELKDMLNSVDRFMKAAMKNLVRPRRNDVVTTYPVTGEMYVDRPVFYHYRIWPNAGHKGGMTIAVMYDNHSRSYMFGFAMCHIKDTYVKKVGDELAWLDLNDSLFAVPADEFASMIVKAYSPTISKAVNITATDPVQFIRSIPAARMGFFLDQWIEEQQLFDIPSNIRKVLNDSTLVVRGRNSHQF